jgi:hypothetical protein
MRSRRRNHAIEGGGIEQIGALLVATALFAPAE